MDKIVFRADGSSTIGLGHIQRCVALSQMLKNGFLMSIAIYEPDKKTIDLLLQHHLSVLKLKTKYSLDYARSFDAVILDGYWFDNEYVKKIKMLGKKVIQIDDLVGSEFYADIVINHAIGADYSNSVLHNCKHLLVGTRYALLRQEFLKVEKHTRAFPSLDSITVCMGGADPRNYTLRILNSIKDLRPDVKLNVLAGSAYSYKDELMVFKANNKELSIQVHEALNAEQIIQLLENTSLFICSASTIVYEALAVKVPIACFQTAQNQNILYKGLIQTKALTGMNDLQSLSDKELSRILLDVILNFKQISSGVQQQSLLIDGLSGGRVRNAIISLWN